MIERKFVNDKKKEFEIEEYITTTLKNVGHSKTELIKTPLGDKIIIHASRPGLVVGKKGDTIKKITLAMKKKFKLDNPEIEIKEVENPMLDAKIVAEKIASTIERYGIQKFKAIAHKVMEEVLDSGALGIEIILSGKIPSARAKSWRFYRGYLKKCGQFAVKGVRRSITFASLKPGTIGVKVNIMPADLKRPDTIVYTTLADAASVSASSSPIPKKEDTPSSEKPVEEKT